MKLTWVKIIIAFLLILLLSANILADKEPITLQMWDWFLSQSKFLDNEIKMFQEKYPHIRIKRTKQVSHKYRDVVNFAHRSLYMPDILAIPVDSRNEWIKAGYLLPLHKWVDKEFINRFPKGSFVNGINVFEGKCYSFPISASDYWCQFYLNPSVFKQAGLVDKKGDPLYPRTWEEVKEYAKTITKKGEGKYFGFGFAYKPEHLHANMFYEWARVAGARAGNQELHLAVDYKVGRYNFTESDGYIRMFKFILSMMKDGSLYPGSLSMDSYDELLRRDFAEGKVAMIMGGCWNMSGWEASHPNFKDYDCVMIPPPDEKGYRALCDVTLANCYLGIAATTKYPEESWKFMEWFAQPEVGIRYVKAGLGLSIFPSANTIENARYRQFGQYMEIAAKYALPGPNPFARNPELANVNMKPVKPNHIDLFWDVIFGKIDEKSIPMALKDLENRLNRALKEGMGEAIKKGYNVSMSDLKFPDWDPLKPYEQL